MNDIEKAIEVLKMENELMQFNPISDEALRELLEIKRLFMQLGDLK